MNKDSQQYKALAMILYSKEQYTTAGWEVVSTGAATELYMKDW
jgi:hypothetical protein